jgi:hypothetical protein
MTRPSPAQLEGARRLLAHEGAAESAATAAGRVYDKLTSHLAPLVGKAGVQALFVRSAKLAKGEVDCLVEGSTLDSSTKLRECLQSQDPAIAIEAAAVLFGTFFALLGTFIGERLTIQVLRSAWPTIEEAATNGEKK